MNERGHLELRELLALRDGEAAPASRAHVEHCEGCAAEVRRLRRVRAELRALRPLAPRGDLWPRIRDRLYRRRRRRLIAAGLAAAAALAGLLVLHGGDTAERLPAGSDPWIAEVASADLGPMITRSRELESVLRTHAPSRQVQDVPTALAVSVVEDRLQLIDRALAQSRRAGVDRALVRDLWSQRVEALETLVGLRFNPPDDGGWR